MPNHIPLGPEPIAQKLIELLKQTEMEERKRINFGITWGLKTRRRRIESYLHHLFKPKILKKDNYKCRACSSTDNLELVRLYGGLSVSFEERWSEKNMFTLCENCHKIFDSFMGRMWRLKLNISSVETAIQLLRNEDLSEFPPIPPIEKFRARSKLICREAITLIKVLNKAVDFQRQDNLEKAKRYLALSQRELTYHYRREILTQNQYEEFRDKLRVARENLCLGKEIGCLIEEIRHNVIEIIKKKVSPEVFSEFILLREAS